MRKSTGSIDNVRPFVCEVNFGRSSDLENGKHHKGRKNIILYSGSSSTASDKRFVGSPRSERFSRFTSSSASEHTLFLCSLLNVFSFSASLFSLLSGCAVSVRLLLHISCVVLHLSNVHYRIFLAFGITSLQQYDILAGCYFFDVVHTPPAWV